MSTAQRRLMRRHALWQATAIFGDEETDWEHFVQTGSTEKATPFVVPYNDALIDSLVERGLLR